MNILKYKHCLHMSTGDTILVRDVRNKPLYEFVHIGGNFLVGKVGKKTILTSAKYFPGTWFKIIIIKGNNPDIDYLLEQVDEYKSRLWITFYTIWTGLTSKER